MSTSEAEYAMDRSFEDEEAPRPVAPHADAGGSKGKGKGVAGPKGKAKPRVSCKKGLTAEQKDTVIEFLIERPHLYQKQSSEFKNATRRNVEWNEVAAGMGVELPLIRSWYYSMRTILGKLKRRMTKSGGAPLNMTASERYVWAKFQFLLCHIENLAANRGIGFQSSLSRVDTQLAVELPEFSLTGSTAEESQAPPLRAQQHMASTSGLTTSARTCCSCCETIRLDLLARVNQATNHRQQFWGYLDGIVKDMPEDDWISLSTEMVALANGWRSRAPAPTPMGDSSSVSGGVFQDHDPIMMPSQQQTTPSRAQSTTYMEWLVSRASETSMQPVYLPRLSPRKRAHPRHIPQRSSTPNDQLAEDLGLAISGDFE